MTIYQFLLILKARYKIILLTGLVTVATAMLITAVLPRSYSATATILLNYKGIDPVTGMNLPALLMPGYMATQAEIIKSRNIALRVVDKLGMANDPEIQKKFADEGKSKEEVNNFMAEFLLNKLDVKPSKESSIIEITFKNPNQAIVALVANTFAEKYRQASVEFKVDPAQKAASYFGQQIKVLKENLEKAQGKFSRYQQEHGITNLEQGLDIENMRLNELSSQFSAIQASVIEAQSRKSTARKSSADSPDVENNPMVQKLRYDLANAEANLEVLSKKVGENHPEYQSALAQLVKMRSQLQREIGRASNSISSTSTIAEQREAELKIQLEMQKIKVLELNRIRDESTVLKKDVETAQTAIDTVTQRFSQTRIEGESDQSDITILNPAITPDKPSSPKVFLILALSIVMGSVLGVMFGFLSELIDRRIRSVQDFVQIMDVPVFSIFDENLNKPKSKLLENQAAKQLSIG